MNNQDRKMTEFYYKMIQILMQINKSISNLEVMMKENYVVKAETPEWRKK